MRRQCDLAKPSDLKQYLGSRPADPRVRVSRGDEHGYRTHVNKGKRYPYRSPLRDKAEA